MTSTSIDEPIPAPDQAPGVGSMSSHEPVPPGRDLLRALSCALLVAASVASPGSALLLAPFVPAIVAIRLLRQRAGQRQFLVTATIASLLGGLSAAADHRAFLAGALAALLLVPALGVVHARAARHDPIDSPEIVEWPEPRLRTGLTPTIGAWIVALLVLFGVVALVAPGFDSLSDSGATLVRDAYSPYERGCRDGGAFEERTDFCAQTLEQRDQVLTIVEDHAPELLAALLAIAAFGAAGTAHLVVLARGRRVSKRVRRSWRLRELELHWSAAYVLAAGLVMFMLAGDGNGGGAGGDVLVVVRSVGVGLATLGALAVVSQGIGLVAWMFSRGGSPTWYRVLLLAFALFVLPVTMALLFFVGVLDMALHPRRRAAKRERTKR